ncbi:PAS/PAC sensor signal transduction histidine kinase [Psychrobacillus insolitus]|uniref:histidine kinase n=1 Tax=Psychrobacillus insolitus TaxID=1461 RepID=A0A2W7MKD0_9BACI|nr:ATP-binding protein [Psychrobacillus insolitus]PZX06978.1 PAS/PAC sensor signal transduction histidine kinase [Psychrobacillus insolitus]
MMSFQNRILRIYSILIGLLLAGVGLVLGQLYPLFVDNTANSLVNSKVEDISAYLSTTEVPKDIQNQIIHKVSFNDHIIESTDIQQTFWMFLFIILFLAFLIAIIIGASVFKKYAVPIEHLTQTAMELAKGNYRVRAFEDDFSGMSKLSKSINILARNLHDISVMRETEKERLKTLIENMGSALLMIDRNGETTIANRSFLKLFQLKFEDVDGKLFRKIGLPDQIEEFIDKLFLTESSNRQQLNIKKNHFTYYMDAYGAPVIGEHGRWLGIVIVMHDITELKKLEQVRKDFVANVSHELKTPVTSIKGFSETLLFGAYKKEETLLSFLEIIHKESNRLQALIIDLLDLSKVEQTGYEISKQKVYFSEIINSSIELTIHLADKKNITIETNIDEQVVILGETNRLKQIIVNLIANAINYSLENTMIKLSVYQNKKYGIFEIEDQGIGISKVEITRIFERFYRVDRARSRNSGGTGLGLAIVKHLVEAHQGYIEVHSEEGKGTIFKVYIPIVNT